MLSCELGTHLTGRFYQFELYPFSFSEFIAFKNKKIEKPDAYTTKAKENSNAYLMNILPQVVFLIISQIKTKII